MLARGKIQPSMPSPLIRFRLLFLIVASWSTAAVAAEVPALADWLARLTPPPAESLPLTIPFKEARQYPFRKYPKNFSGQIVLEFNGDVLVTYEFPSAYRLVLAEDSVQLEEPGSESRDLGNPPGLALLRSLMRWDVPAIKRDWSLSSATENGDETTLDLLPVDPDFAQSVRSLQIVFLSERVTAVTVKQADGQQREYQFGEPVSGSEAP